MMKEKYFWGIMVMLMAFIGINTYGNNIYIMDNSDVNRVYDFRKVIGVTWKLYGFGTVGEDEVQKGKPEKGEEWWKEEQYTILFKEDGTLEGHTFSNDFSGEYSIDGSTLVIGDLWATEIGEEYDGYKYYEALYSPLTHVFEIRDDQLLLYYNEGKNYLLFDNVTTHAVAQTDYYYHMGNKIPLTVNPEKVCVSVSKECGETIERIRSKVQILQEIRDEIFDIIVISQSDYENLTSLDFWEKDVKYVITTSCYFTEVNEEVFATPYLNIELKKEEDRDLLTSYVEKYKLRNVGDGPFSPLMPLWFVLAITPESNLNTINCANELYESGDFAESVPDLAGNSIIATIRDVIITIPRASLEIYNLQGQRLIGPPTKGLYIKNGKKVVVR